MKTSFVRVLIGVSALSIGGCTDCLKYSALTLDSKESKYCERYMVEKEGATFFKRCENGTSLVKLQDGRLWHVQSRKVLPGCNEDVGHMQPGPTGRLEDITNWKVKGYYKE